MGQPIDKGSIVTVRNNVSANDSANPTIGTGKNFVGFRTIEAEVIVGGTNPSWNVTPLLANDAGDSYQEVETVTLDEAKTYYLLIEVLGNTDVNFRVDGQAGTSPTITIKAKGVN